MQNFEKIKILKQNIIKLLKTTSNIDEQLIFIFAKKQRKEMQIEISKGELKCLVNSLLIEFNQNESSDYNSSLKYDYLLDELNSYDEMCHSNRKVFNDLL